MGICEIVGGPPGSGPEAPGAKHLVQQPPKAAGCETAEPWEGGGRAARAERRGRQSQSANFAQEPKQKEYRYLQRRGRGEGRGGGAASPSRKTHAPLRSAVRCAARSSPSSPCSPAARAARGSGRLRARVLPHPLRSSPEGQGKGAGPFPSPIVPLKLDRPARPAGIEGVRMMYRAFGFRSAFAVTLGFLGAKGLAFGLIVAAWAGILLMAR